MPVPTTGHLIWPPVLPQPARKGIDVYFRRMSAARIFEAVFPLLNPFARIPVCGLISVYNATSLPPGPPHPSSLHLMRAILTKRLTLPRGSLALTFFLALLSGGISLCDVPGWRRRIKYREDVAEGLLPAPRALLGYCAARTSANSGARLRNASLRRTPLGCAGSSVFGQADFGGRVVLQP